MIKKLLLAYALLASLLFSQDLKVVHMEGTYDLDGDGLKEFATVRLCAAAAPAPDIVVPAIIELAPEIAPAAVIV